MDPLLYLYKQNDLSYNNYQRDALNIIVWPIHDARSEKH